MTNEIPLPDFSFEPGSGCPDGDGARAAAIEKVGRITRRVLKNVDPVHHTWAGQQLVESMRRADMLSCPAALYGSACGTKQDACLFVAGDAPGTFRPAP